MLSWDCDVASAPRGPGVAPCPASQPLGVCTLQTWRKFNLNSLQKVKETERQERKQHCCLLRVSTVYFTEEISCRPESMYSTAAVFW